MTEPEHVEAIFNWNTLDPKDPVSYPVFVELLCKIDSRFCNEIDRSCASEKIFELLAPIAQEAHVLLGQVEFAIQFAKRFEESVRLGNAFLFESRSNRLRYLDLFFKDLKLSKRAFFDIFNMCCMTLGRIGTFIYLEQKVSWNEHDTTIIHSLLDKKLHDLPVRGSMNIVNQRAYAIANHLTTTEALWKFDEHWEQLFPGFVGRPDYPLL